MSKCEDGGTCSAALRAGFFDFLGLLGQKYLTEESAENAEELATKVRRHGENFDTD